MARRKKAKDDTRYVGIDVSAKTLHVAILDRNEPLEFDNTHAGFKQLGKVITKNGREAKVVLEATGTYHLDLAVFLNDLDGCSLMVANPRATKAFHSAQSQRAKTDAVDARSLAEFAFRMPFTPWVRPPKAALELRFTARYRNQLVTEKTRLTNQVKAHEATGTTPQWVINEQKEQIEELKGRIQRVENEMKRQAKASPDIWKHLQNFMTVPGVGQVTGLQVAAEFMLLDPTMTSKEITAWAGLDPRPRQSGTSVRGNSAISKRGSARMRLILFMPAMVATKPPGPFRCLKERVAARSGKRMKGIVAVMRKLLTVLWAMYRTESAYDVTMASSKSSAPKAA